MKRRHWIEIHEEAWCPRTIRDASTDYLQFVISVTKPYLPMLELLADVLGKTGTRQVLDLCSGGTGPWQSLQPALARQGINITVVLSDKYPNLGAIERLAQMSNPAIRYISKSVDATQVPPELHGFQTLFTSFHHFRPEQARQILSDAARQGQGIGIFEATQRTPMALFSTLFVPLAVVLMTPWIRPFRWSRLFWTYLFPIMPLITLFDGLVSCLRTYTVEELSEMTRGLNANGFHWKMGTVKGKHSPVPVTYLIGLPGENPKTNFR